MEWSAFIPLFAFILGLLGKVFYDMWHDNYVEVKQRQKDALKEHYADIIKVIRPFTEYLKKTYNDLGKIVSVSSRDEKTDIGDFFWPYSYEGYQYEFSCHFPKQAKQFNLIIEEAQKNNEKVEELEKELFASLNKEFDLEAAELSYNTSLPTLLREELCEIAKERKSIKRKHKESPFIDLPADWGIIKINRNQEGNFIVHTPRTNEPDRVWVETQEEASAKKFKRALSQMLNSEILITQMRDLFNNAGNLERQFRQISNESEEIQRLHLKFKKPLKRSRKCPTCKLIFK